MHPRRLEKNANITLKSALVPQAVSHARAGGTRWPRLRVVYANASVPSFALIRARIDCRYAISRFERVLGLLFQFTLSLLREVQMLLDYLCRVVGKLLHIGIAPAVCFFLELRQVLLVIPNHRVHVGLV